MSEETLEVRLRAIDGDHCLAFMDMACRAHQRDFLHHNAYSIAPSKFDKTGEMIAVIRPGTPAPLPPRRSTA